MCDPSNGGKRRALSWGGNRWARIEGPKKLGIEDWEEDGSSRRTIARSLGLSPKKKKYGNKERTNERPSEKLVSPVRRLKNRSPGGEKNSDSQVDALVDRCHRRVWREIFLCLM